LLAVNETSDLNENPKDSHEADVAPDTALPASQETNAASSQLANVPPQASSLETTSAAKGNVSKGHDRKEDDKAQLREHDPVRDNLAAIDAIGTRTQKLSGAAVLILIFLFVGFILPTTGALEKVRSIRSQLLYVEKEKETRRKKSEARRNLRPPDLSFVGPSNAPLKKCGDAKEVKENIAAVKKELQDLEYDFLVERDNPERKEKLVRWLRGQTKSINDKLQVAAGFLQKGENECQENAASVTREYRDRLASLRLSAETADLSQSFATESGRTIPVRYLGVFGLQIEGLDEARIPFLYLPILWSALLLVLMVYVSHARTLMINVYARTLSAADKDQLLSKFGPISRSRWWWLAPLPKVSGQRVNADNLKFALGWKHFEIVAVMGVLALLIILIVMQVMVIMISWRFIPVLTGGYESVIVFIVLGVIASWVLIIAGNWIWPWHSIPDFKANEEDIWQYRRAIISMLAVGVLAAVVFRRVAPGTERLKITRTPRFWRNEPRRFVEAGDGIEVGFYRNQTSNVIHYVSYLRFPTEFKLRQRRKRHRLPLLRIERKQRRSLMTLVAQGLSKNKSTKRLREPEFAARQRNAKSKDPTTRLIRGVSGIVRRLVPAKTEELFAKPETASETESASPTGQRNSSRPNVVVMQALPSGPGRHEATQRTAVRAGEQRFFGNDNRKELKPPKLNDSQIPFAIEQEALRMLSEIQKAKASGGSNTPDLGAVVSLLKSGIENRSPDRSCLRLYDLLAVIAVRNGDEETLNWLISYRADSRLPELQNRIRRWRGEGKWRSHWTQAGDQKVFKRNQWAGLPM
jgi:hypothetical protein